MHTIGKIAGIIVSAALLALVMIHPSNAAFLSPSRPGAFLAPLDLSLLDVVVNSLKVGTLSGILEGTAGTVGTATAGTDYQLPYWVLSGSNLYPSSTSYSVGIGTASPSSTLHVAGNATLAGMVNIDRMQYGGGKTTDSSSTSTLTLTAAQVCDNTTYEWTPTVANATTAIPTGAALAALCMSEDGSYKRLRLKNLASPASTTFPYALVSNGINLKIASGTGNASGTIPGGGWAEIGFDRASSTQIDVSVVIYQ